MFRDEATAETDDDLIMISLEADAPLRPRSDPLDPLASRLRGRRVGLSSFPWTEIRSPRVRCLPRRLWKDLRFKEVNKGLLEV